MGVGKRTAVNIDSQVGETPQGGGLHPVKDQLTLDIIRGKAVDNAGQDLGGENDLERDYKDEEETADTYEDIPQNSFRFHGLVYWHTNIQKMSGQSPTFYQI